MSERSGVVLELRFENRRGLCMSGGRWRLDEDLGVIAQKLPMAHSGKLALSFPRLWLEVLFVLGTCRHHARLFGNHAMLLYSLGRRRGPVIFPLAPALLTSRTVGRDELSLVAGMPDRIMRFDRSIV